MEVVVFISRIIVTALVALGVVWAWHACEESRGREVYICEAPTDMSRGEALVCEPFVGRD